MLTVEDLLSALDEQPMVFRSAVKWETRSRASLQRCTGPLGWH